MPVTPQSPQTPSDATDPDAFWNSYRVFAMALEFLSQKAEEQCALMGNYNVAWELNDDVSAGKYLLSSAPGRFTTEQAEGIRALAEALDSIPTDLLHTAEGHESNVEAMRHPVWSPLRQMAAALVATLAPVSSRCETYMSSGQDVP